MSEPLISVEQINRARVYTLIVPFAWLEVVKYPRLMLLWWLAKMAWRERSK
jgi:hypothetical protein